MGLFLFNSNKFITTQQYTWQQPLQISMSITYRVKQGKSEGFDSCDRSSNLTENWIKIIDFSVHMT